MTVTSVDLTPFASARLKILLMGPLGSLSRRVIDSVRSLQKCEFVSADALIDQEIAGRTTLGNAAARRRAAAVPVPDETMLAIIRRWFWTRRRDHGFVLGGFPVSVAQALVFDQWLDELDESLTACLWLDETGTSTACSPVGDHGVTAHYRNRGLFFRMEEETSIEASLAGVFQLTCGLLADR